MDQVQEYYAFTLKFNLIIVVSTYLRGKYKPKEILTSSWWLVFVHLVRNSLRKSLNLPASLAGITKELWILGIFQDIKSP